ncbi:hypothetical protein [Methylobacterium isbiliense]|uniref:hypothetical protein n=1 Tax=Methylobacterium isbiliense TaxID=315478 RepID=UPI001EE293B4|nr:hypothetical protein [Methylobacterium isbiliense]MDN3623924.1 hypothetical protein [Methylobacterium isbiliense]
MTRRSLPLLAALAVLGALQVAPTLSSSAQASPLGAAAGLAAQAEPETLQHVQYWGHRHHHHWGHRHHYRPWGWGHHHHHRHWGWGHRHHWGHHHHRRHYF